METNIRIETSKNLEKVRVMDILTKDGNDSLRICMMSHLSDVEEMLNHYPEDTEGSSTKAIRDHIKFVRFLLVKFMPNLRVNIDYEYEQFLKTKE